MKIDLHVHSSEISCCSQLSIPELIRLYKNAGFGGFVLTNHFYRGGGEIMKERGYSDYGKIFLETACRAYEEGQKEGMLRTIGISMAEVKLGLRNIAYNMDRFCTLMLQNA